MKNIYDIIRRPVITEQSMEAVADKKYVFMVDVDANKTEIKSAIEQIFSVKGDARAPEIARASASEDGRIVQVNFAKPMTAECPPSFLTAHSSFSAAMRSSFVTDPAR